MMFFRKTATQIAWFGICATALSFACKSGGDGGESAGGSGDNQGGGGGESTGSGGNTSKGGKGGTNSAGTNGQGGASANGGSVQGGGGGALPVAGNGGGTAGAGGMSMTGGATGCTPLSDIAGKADADIPANLVFCEPTCIYRPNWPGHHTCGPAGSTYKAVALKTDGFCAGQYNQDGVFTVPRTRMEAAAFSATANGLSVSNPVPGVSKAYLVGGQAEYDKAVSGKVAVTIWWSAFSNDGAHGISNIHEYLYDRGELPYTIAIFLDGGTPWFSDNVDLITRMKRLRDSVLPALQAKWPKISKDPNYRSISGQSTAGGESFDAAWLFTDIVSKGIGGSSSVACFTCMGGQGITGDECTTLQSCRTKNSSYAKEVMFCPARPIRWTTTVGTCDIYGTLQERLDTKVCGGGTDPGSVDASQCHATWPTINQDLADALKDKGVPYQLIKITGGGHTPNDWSIALPVQLRWAFKDVTCAK